MKKIFICMMLVGALLSGSSVYAQNPVEGTTGASVQKEKTQKKNERKGKKMDRPAFNPFDGIQLTEDQQNRLQTLRKGLGPVELNKDQQAKIKENSNLSSEQKQQLKKERNAKRLETKKNYLNGVKEILTPEQYIVFLENVYLYSPQDQGMKGQAPSKKVMKSNKKTMKSDRKIQKSGKRSKQTKEKNNNQ